LEQVPLQRHQAKADILKELNYRTFLKSFDTPRSSLDEELPPARFQTTQTGHSYFGEIADISTLA
jgi:hypothetical protein